MTFPQNVASEQRDIALARHMEAGTVRVFADGFGLWHAVVPVAIKGQPMERVGFAHPLEVAKYCIRLALQQRAPRDTYIDVQPIRLISRDLEDGTAEYMEDTTNDRG